MVKAETNAAPTPPRAKYTLDILACWRMKVSSFCSIQPDTTRWSDRMIETFTINVCLAMPLGNQQCFIPRNPIYFHSEQECKAFLERSAYQDLNRNGRDQAFCVKKTAPSWQKVQ